MLIFSNILKAVSEYRTKFPDVKVELDFTDRLVDLVGEGYDIAIRAGNLVDSGLMAKRIGMGCHFLVASESYLRKTSALRHPKDLLQHACIKRVDPPSDDIWVLRTKQGKTARIQIPSGVSSNAFSAIKSLALMGQSCASSRHPLPS